MRASVTVDVDINDPKTLYEKAAEDYRRQNVGRDTDDIEAEIIDFLGAASDPKLDRCLIQLFDNPQASMLGLMIRNSSVSINDGLRTSTVLHISTRHLTTRERTSIRTALYPAVLTSDGSHPVALPHAEHGALYLKPKGTGFLVRVPRDDNSPMSTSPEMRAILAHASSAGAWMIDFDDDEPISSKLPVFEPTTLIVFDQNSDDDDPTFWSNQDGWADRESATTFTIEEAAAFQLPSLGASPVWVDRDDPTNSPYPMLG